MSEKGPMEGTSCLLPEDTSIDGQKEVLPRVALQGGGGGSPGPGSSGLLSRALAVPAARVGPGWRVGKWGGCIHHLPRCHLAVLTRGPSSGGHLCPPPSIRDVHPKDLASLPPPCQVSHCLGWSLPRVSPSFPGGSLQVRRFHSSLPLPGPRGARTGTRALTGPGYGAERGSNGGGGSFGRLRAPNTTRTPRPAGPAARPEVTQGRGRGAAAASTHVLLAPPGG